MKKLLLALLFTPLLALGQTNNYNIIDKAYFPTTAGTSAYCWTSNGASALPSWQVCGGGGGGLTIGNAVTGGGANRLLYEDASQNLAATSGFTFGPTAGQGLAIPAGTAASAVSPLAVTQTWNGGGAAFPGVTFKFTETSAVAGSFGLQISGGAAGTTNLLSVSRLGEVVIGSSNGSTLNAMGDVLVRANEFTVGSVGPVIYSGNVLGWASGSVTFGTSPDTAFSRLGAGIVGVGSGASGNVTGTLAATNYRVQGSGSGSVTIAAPAAAGANTLTLPAGTTNFSATGGASQVVKQTTSGGALTVAQLACSDLSNGATGCSTATGTSGATIPLLNGTNTWSGVQTFSTGDLKVGGAGAGTLTLAYPNSASSFTLTFPAGSTDLSATGGASQVLKQTGAGSAITVAQLACSDLSNAGTGCSGAAGLTTVGDVTSGTVAFNGTVGTALTSTNAGMTITAAQGTSAQAGGAVAINGGIGGSSSGTGGAVTVNSGTSTTGNTGATTLRSANTTAGGGTAGVVSVTGGNSDNAGVGGNVVITSGTGGATGTAGTLALTSGNGGGTSGASGTVSLKSGTTTSGNTGALTIASENALGANSTGGAISITVGNSVGSGTSGTLALTGGTTVTGNGSQITITGGAGPTAAAGAGGAVTIAGGAGTTSQSSGGGNLVLNGGTASQGTSSSGPAGTVAATGGTGFRSNAGSTTGGIGGAVTVRGGTGGAAAGATSVGGAGAVLTLQGGTAGAGTTTTAAGGNVNLVGGTADTTGNPGEVQVNGVSGFQEACWQQFVATNVPVTGTSYPFFLANRAYRVKAARVYQSSAVTPTVDIIKDTGTTAPGAGTTVLTGVITFGAANTVVVGTVVTTLATIAIAAGDRLSTKWAGTVGVLTGGMVCALLQPI